MGQLHFKDLSDYKFYKQTLAALQDPNKLPTTCTRYEFVKAIKEIGDDYYQRLFLAYSNSMEIQFYWNTVNELDRTNEDFIRLAKMLEVTDDEIYEVFRRVAIDRLEKPWL